MCGSALCRVAVAVCLLLARESAAQTPAGQLRFVPCAGEPRALDLTALGGAAAGREVTVQDPVYRRAKRYAALPMGGVLERGFEASVLAGGARFRLIAADGYTKEASGALLADGSGFLAFRDLEASSGSWEPLAKGGDPGPFYLVWTGEQTGEERPWPYQLVRIEQECPARP